MKKPIIIFVSMITIFIVISLSMLILHICPPKGPWPTPPWCDGKAYIPFEYKELGYIQERFNHTDKRLDFIIGTMDIWGNPHLYIDLGENSKDHVETTMKKIREVGGEGVYLTDFVSISNSKEIQEGLTGAESMSGYEMKSIVSEARKNGQNKVMLTINLYDPEAPMRRYKGKSMDGTVSGELLKDMPIKNWKKLFDSWERYLSEEATKAGNAGVSHLIITPSDFSFSGFKDKEYLNKEYSLFADAAKQRFKGKIGVSVYGSEMPNLDAKTLEKIDFIVILWDPNGDHELRKIFKGVGEDITSIEDSLVDWLNLINFSRTKGKETYILVIMPSYDGALQKGWIEPGAVYGEGYKKDFKEQALLYEGLFRAIYKNRFNITGVISYGYWWTDRIYPEVRILRNDLSHSIRGKDAENIFYKWSKIFR